MREELYAQTFDELIREVTINCAERGLLLLRVRDEMRMTIAAYQVGPAVGLLQAQYDAQLYQVAAPKLNWA